MSDILARLIAAGTPADLVAEVARLEARASIAEEAAEKRREKDRERKRAPRIPRNSAPSVEFQPNPSLEVPPQTPLPNPNPESAPLNPPKKARGTGRHLMPADWALPAVAELSPKARACAEQWTRESYETVGEGFILYWRNERKMKVDWRDTWCGWVIREHSKVMRDQKFGNAPTAPAKQFTPEEQLAANLRTADLYDRLGRNEEAAEIRRKWGTGPPGQPISAALPGLLRRAQAGMDNERGFSVGE